MFHLASCHFFFSYLIPEEEMKRAVTKELEKITYSNIFSNGSAVECLNIFTMLMMKRKLGSYYVLNLMQFQMHSYVSSL